MSALQSRGHLREALIKHGVPESAWGGIERYLFDRIEPGSFLCAVFANDFVEAVGGADDQNIGQLRRYASFMYNELPPQYARDSPWGSYEAEERWLALRDTTEGR